MRIAARTSPTPAAITTSCCRASRRSLRMPCVAPPRAPERYPLVLFSHGLRRASAPVDVSLHASRQPRLRRRLGRPHRQHVGRHDAAGDAGAGRRATAGLCWRCWRRSSPPAARRHLHARPGARRRGRPGRRRIIDRERIGMTRSQLRRLDHADGHGARSPRRRRDAAGAGRRVRCRCRPIRSPTRSTSPGAATCRRSIWSPSATRCCRCAACTSCSRRRAGRSAWRC